MSRALLAANRFAKLFERARFRLQCAPMATITFLGAAGTVTGSKYLVEAGGKRLLLDCGLFQGPKELRLRNWDALPEDPSTFDWVVLTHAHLDHTGWLPRLVRGGYKGQIFADAATIELCNLLLPDAAHIMGEDADNANRKGYSKHKPALPLYTEDDVDPVLKTMREIPRSGPYTISPQFTVRPHDAGHILGSCSIELTITENGRSLVVLFSGDVGRYSRPILKDPEPPPRCDVLLCESTYGDRDHPADPDNASLVDIINRVAKRGGVIVVPAFAIGRTQELMYVIRQLEDANRIPKLPVYVDSPMGISATELYLRHKEDHDAQFLQDEARGNPLDAHTLHVMRSVDDSKQINEREDARDHHLRERHGDRRTHSAPSRATAARPAQRCPARRLPGRRHARPRASRWRKDFAHSRPGYSGARRSDKSWPIFRACRSRRNSALAFRHARCAEDDVHDARRAASIGGAEIADRIEDGLARQPARLSPEIRFERVRRDEDTWLEHPTFRCRPRQRAMM